MSLTNVRTYGGEFVTGEQHDAKHYATMVRDSEMLNWMQSHGAYVAWGNDCEICSVRWNDRDGQYKTDNYSDWREAIDNAMRGNFKEQSW